MAVGTLWLVDIIILKQLKHNIASTPLYILWHLLLVFNLYHSNWGVVIETIHSWLHGQTHNKRL